MDPAAAEAAVSPHTRHLLPVHLYGQMADMEALLDLATRIDLSVVEDACQAPGAVRCGRRAGATGVAAAFSFYPGKNLGAFGDAGALTTPSIDIAQAVRSLREHGQTQKYIHETPGYTARLDSIQALVLARKLEHLEDENAERRRVAAHYAVRLDGVGDVRLPPVAPQSSPVWHLYPIATAHRDGLQQHLAARGVGTGLHYPQPPHLSRAYASLGYREGAFPVAEALASELLSLPIYGGMSESDLDYVVESIRTFFDG
jgi:dTDP-4-amino-4,6-dideoxygalactose transaminase